MSFLTLEFYTILNISLLSYWKNASLTLAIDMVKVAHKVKHKSHLISQFIRAELRCSKPEF